MREGSDRLSSICSMCYRSLAFVIAFCFSGSMAAQKVTMVDVGVAVPRSVITNETVSASMVVSPRDFSGITTLQIIPAQLPGIPGVNAADLLKKYKVQAGDSGGFVPADQPFSFTATDNIQLKITRSDLENAPVTTLKLPLIFSAPATSAGPGYHIPPLTLAGAVHLIHGPLSGDSRKTQITVNGTAAKILAESPQEVFCFVPPATPVGPAEWILEDSGRRAKLKTWVLALQMSADKLKLLKGESTAFHVYVKGVETIPQEAWFGSGDVPELVDPALITKFFAELQAAFAEPAGRAGADAGKYVSRNGDDERRQ